LNEKAGIPVLFVDDAILVILATILAPDYGRLWLVHRLDRDTSGVLVLARSAAAHHNLNDQFRDRQVEKRYHALVAPAPSWEQMTVDIPLRKDGDRQHRTVADPQRGKPARTDFIVLERYTQAALLEAQPLTGYTHQIRAHLRASGCPIIADGLYRLPDSPAFDPPPIDRMALHAFSISIAHPLSGENLVFNTPHPADFVMAIDKLRI
jgi:tRNA pseudouridine32 synthase/23S rRNA pseudouridine746 synthase